MNKFSYAAAKAYCRQLVFIEKVKLNVYQFFVKMHQHFEIDINQKMINQFILWVASDDSFQIHQSVLYEYQLIEDSCDISDLIKKISLIENEDYKIVLNSDRTQSFQEDEGDVSKMSRNESKPLEFPLSSYQYYLTQDAFKIILATKATLMRTKYYFLLETIFGLYKEYQIITTYQARSLSAAISPSLIISHDDHVDLLYIIDHKLDNLARQNREDTNFLAKQIITLQKMTNDLGLNIANIQSSAKYACKSLKCIIEQSGYL